MNDSRPETPRRVSTLLLVLLCGALCGSRLTAEPGYRARSCGLDMNRNGVIGEAADCRVCDGHTKDPDGDGTEEDLFYVDAQQGTDAPTCGAPDAPCATIAFTWRERADGAADGAEDIVCARGVFREQLLSPRHGGVPESYVLPRSGSQVRDFELPRDPTMLVGWDYDRDGQYPPVDEDDQAVLDGWGLSRAFLLGASHVEIAHLAIRDYGVGKNGDSGVWKWQGEGTITHHWYHDLSITGINQGLGGISGTSVANLFSNTVRLSWVAWTNIELLDIDDWGWRGSGGADAEEEGPFRLQNLTYRMKGCRYSRCGDEAALTFWKTWAHLSQVEILDNFVDGNVEAWEPKPSGGPHGALFVSLTPCSQRFAIRNNFLRDIKVGLMLQPGFGDIECRRPIQDVVYEGNVAENSFFWGAGSSAIVHVADRTKDSRATVKNIVVRRNVLREIGAGRHERAISSFHDSPGRQGSVTIEENDLRGSGACVTNAAAGVGTWMVRDNHCVAGEHALDLEVMPSAWNASGNTFTGPFGSGPSEGWQRIDLPPPHEGPPGASAVRFTRYAYRDSEGASVVLAVERLGSAAGEVTLRWSTADGSATAGRDFAPGGDTLQWAAGDLSPREIAVPLLPDGEQETTETFEVRLSEASGAELAAPSSAVVSVLDDPTGGKGDAGKLMPLLAKIGGSEGQAVTVVVRRTGAAGPASVRYETRDGTAEAGVDYLPAAGELRWRGGDAAPKSFTIPLLVDSRDEGAETFEVHLSEAKGAPLGAAPVVTVEIADAAADGPAGRSGFVGFARSRAAVREGQAVHLDVTRSGGAQGPASVQVRTASGTARSGDDFLGSAFVVTWSSGDASPRTITVPVNADGIPEGEESFTVLLGQATGAQLGRDDAVVVAVEDPDSVSPWLPGSVRFASTHVDAGEGDGTCEIVVERVGGSRGAVEVTVEAVGTSSLAGADFVPPGPTRLLWGPGEVGARAVSIEILDDDETEPAERVELRLEAPQGGLEIGAPDRATLVVHDDEVPAGAPAAAGEGGAPSLAFAGDGGFVMGWQEAQGGSARVLLRRFDGAGRPRGAAVRVGRRGAQAPAVASAPTGGLGAVWHEPDGGARQVIALATPSGDPRKGHTWVLADGQSGPRELTVSADAEGRFVATWTTQDGVLVLRPFGPKGPLRPPIAFLAAPGSRSAVSFAGDVALAFETADGVALQVLAPDGTPLSPLRRVVTSAAASSPDLAASGDGALVLVWEDDGEHGRDIFGQRLDREANPIGPSFRVNTRGAGDQRRPRVAANGAGDFTVTWIDDPASGDLWVRFFGANGAAHSGDVLVARPSGDGTPLEPTIALGDDDRTFVGFARRTGSGARGTFFRSFAPTLGTHPCVPREGVLCIADGRFRVRTSWHAGSNRRGIGLAEAITNDTGYFWFFEPSNVELVAKALDACSLNQRLWLFAGGLTDLGVLMSVEDTITGDSRSYHNAPGRTFAPVRDTAAFADCTPYEIQAPAQVATRARTKLVAADCGNPGTCLREKRFSVELDWFAPDGAVAAAEGEALTNDTGYFWFFDADNVEVLVKLLDGCKINGHLWVFATGLTDLGVELRITDSASGESATYRRDPGSAFAPIVDLEAFAQACPEVP